MPRFCRRAHHREPGQHAARRRNVQPDCAQDAPAGGEGRLVRPRRYDGRRAPRPDGLQQDRHHDRQRRRQHRVRDPAHGWQFKRPAGLQQPRVSDHGDPGRRRVVAHAIDGNPVRGVPVFLRPHTRLRHPCHGGAGRRHRIRRPGNERRHQRRSGQRLRQRLRDQRGRILQLADDEQPECRGSGQLPEKLHRHDHQRPAGGGLHRKHRHQDHGLCGGHRCDGLTAY